MSQPLSVALFYKDGSSDKVYNVELKAYGSGYIVAFSYGRRGSSLTSGNKTSAPVAYSKALSVYNKLVNEKKAKGYQETLAGTPSISIPTFDERDTGIRPQLLNEVDEEDIEKYLTDDEWIAEEKYDGVRRMLVRSDGEVTGTNRKGLGIGITQDLIDEVLSLKIDTQSIILDGEAVGDFVYVFDIVKATMTVDERLDLLSKVLPKDMQFLKTVPVARTTEEKRTLLDRLRKENAEGIVFKKRTSKYVGGRPNSGGSQLKFKFVATATCMVEKVNAGKSSVSLLVYNEQGTIVPVGNVTVYPNQAMPKPGDIVEVRYLYYFAQGSLFQPVLLGPREDMGKEDCTLKQLKLKKENVLDEQ